MPVPRAGWRSWRRGSVGCPGWWRSWRWAIDGGSPRWWSFGRRPHEWLMVRRGRRRWKVAAWRWPWLFCFHPSKVDASPLWKQDRWWDHCQFKTEISLLSVAITSGEKTKPKLFTFLYGYIVFSTPGVTSSQWNAWDSKTKAQALVQLILGWVFLLAFARKCPGDEPTALQTSRNSAVNCNSVPKIMGVGLKSCSTALKE